MLALIAGVALALPYVLYARRRRGAYGIGLVVAASVYVVFAGSRGTLKELMLELSGVVVFSILAFLGVRYSVYLLALGWVSHVIWDLLLHPVKVSSYAPWWYPVACIGFDLIVAGAIIGAAWRDQTS